MNSFLRKLNKAARKATILGSTLFSRSEAERRRLAALPRYVETMTNLPGFDMKIPDGPSFLASWVEIFDKEIYKFKARGEAVRILDCGANVGVSCLFFRKFYPRARIIAFEPDPKIFACLQHNLKSGGITDIELVSKGVWHAETVLRFHSEGSDGGRINSALTPATIEIHTVRLSDYLNEPVDFLKIDIEGAETEVLLDVAPRLGNVQNLFVEYHSFTGKIQTLDRLLGILNEAGFRVQIQPVGFVSHPFVRVENASGMDMQLNIFAYRQ